MGHGFAIVLVAVDLESSDWVAMLLIVAAPAPAKLGGSAFNLHQSLSGSHQGPICRLGIWCGPAIYCSFSSLQDLGTLGIRPAGGL